MAWKKSNSPRQSGRKALQQPEQAVDSRRPSSPSSSDDDDLAVYRWVNLLSYVVNVAVTYGVGVAGLFGLQSNEVISAKYPTLLTPDGYAFAIWAVIFGAQGIWVLQQFLPLLCGRCCRGIGRLPYTDKIVAVRLTYAFVVLAQVMWTIAFGNEWILPSAVIMLILLWNLSIIVFRQLAPLTSTRPWYGDIMTKFPFHIHFGWILVAAVVNVNVALTSSAANGTIKFYGGAIGGLAVLVVATLLIIIAAGFYLVVPAVAVWGLVAVYLADNGRGALAGAFTVEQVQMVEYGTLGSAGLIALVAILQGARKWIAAFRSRSRGPHASPDKSTNAGGGSGADYRRYRDEDEGFARV
jgi:hypothetical protein